MNLFWFADSHLDHKAIISHCNRPFKSIEEMNGTIIENINKVAGKNDYVFCLGDFSWANPVPFLEVIKAKVHMVRGCHDDHWPREAKEMVESFGYGYYLHGGAFGLPKSTKIWMSHYPCCSWRASFHGSWSLFGHSHNEYQPLGLALDVGVDSAAAKLGEYRPFALEEIRDYMQKQELIFPTAVSAQINELERFDKKEEFGRATRDGETYLK